MGSGTLTLVGSGALTLVVSETLTSMGSGALTLVVSRYSSSSKVMRGLLPWCAVDVDTCPTVRL